MNDVIGNELATGKTPGGCTGKGFLKGRSGNPQGPKPGRSITHALRRTMTKETAAKLAQKLISMAFQGDCRAFSILLDRNDGPLANEINMRLDQAPRPGEDSTTFFERLKAEAIETVAKFFPKADRETLGKREIIVRHIKATPQQAVFTAEGQGSGQCLSTRPRAN